jgi:signal transduction histidine kinase
MRLWPRSLRTQIALSAALLVAAVVALAGVTIALRIEHQDRAQVDQQLRDRAAKAADEADKLVATAKDAGNDRSYGEQGGLLAESDTLVRVLIGDAVVEQRGDSVAGRVPPAHAAGLSTITIGAQRWRSLVAPIDGVPDARVQVLQSLAPVEQRLRDNGRVVAVVALGATVLTALGAWLVAGLLLRPLQRLRHGAAAIRGSSEVDQRLPAVQRPQEVAELSATLNGMLERLQVSMLATRRFTADAGHELRSPLTGLGMDLETLRRNPQLSPAERAETLAAMDLQHRRIVRLLDGLQRLARGDAGALADLVDVDLVQVAAAAVDAARARHPGVTYLLRDDTDDDGLVEGWPDGLRIALDNLLENAALHGRPGGTVSVRLGAPCPEVVTVEVDDDGPGISAAERDTVRGRFVRGSDPAGPGSGLGLALVDQQARLHGGALVLGTSDAGGLAATVSLRRPQT